MCIQSSSGSEICKPAGFITHFCPPAGETNRQPSPARAGARTIQPPACNRKRAAASQHSPAVTAEYGRDFQRFAGDAGLIHQKTPCVNWWRGRNFVAPGGAVAVGEHSAWQQPPARWLWRSSRRSAFIFSTEVRKNIVVGRGFSHCADIVFIRSCATAHVRLRISRLPAHLSIYGFR